MHGGLLNASAIALTTSHLVAAFGPSYYVFDALTQTCLGRYDLGHEASIILFSKLSDGTFLSLDSQGVAIKVSLQQKSERAVLEAQEKYHINSAKGSSQPVLEYSVVSSDSCIYFIEKGSKKLKKFSLADRLTNTISHELDFCSILVIDGNWILAQQNDRNVTCISLAQQKQVLHYENTHAVVSATVSGHNLIIGDQRGKITIVNGFFNPKVHNYISRLEWHTGPVKCLKILGQYLYSAGVESVVVLWHLRDLSRDFLPRIGTAINSLVISQSTNQIVCGLSDSTVRVIDLAKDKQLKTFKLVVDPKGYSPVKGQRFTSQTVHYQQSSDRIVMNGLPGRLQSISLRGSGQNTEMEVVPRNLISQLDNNVMSPHRVKCFSFSRDSSCLMVCIQELFHCSLKFYRRRYGEDYELVSKVENPHKNQVDDCYTLPGASSDKFVTFSSSDKSVRVWGEKKEKKRSIVDADEVFWRCEQEIRFRNLAPTSVHCGQDTILVVFNHREIAVFTSRSSQSYQLQKAFCPSAGLPLIKKVYLLEETKSNKLKVLTISADNVASIVEWDLSSNSMKVSSRYSNSNARDITFVSGETKFALFAHEEAQTEIIVGARSGAKLSEGYRCEGCIETGFWRGEQLILITSSLILQSLDGKQFVTFRPAEQSMDLEEESTQVVKEYSGLALDIFGLNERWNKREVAKKGRKIEDLMGEVHLLGSCSSALQELADQLLM